MDSNETPLDVLSRAATLIQDKRIRDMSEGNKSPIVINSDECMEEDGKVSKTSPSRKELPTSEKKERRWRSRQQEPIAKPAKQTERSPGKHKNSVNGGTDVPLDMSTRSRPPPPPYPGSQSAPTRPIVQYHRPSVITWAANVNNNEKHSGTNASADDSTDSDGGSSDVVEEDEKFKPGHRRELFSGTCDPVIDEHFRRSLGKDYLHVFSNNNSSGSGSSSVSAGLSVDDHFAKALGDTWLKLQGNNHKEKERHPEQRDVHSPSPRSPLSLRQQQQGLVST